MADRNIDRKTVEGFGAEWAYFDQRAQSASHLLLFEKFFLIFPWHRLPEQACGLDLGCGSGRWARLVAPRVGALHCIDPSPEALDVAKRNLRGYANCHFHLAGVDEIPLDDDSMDFGYALGVLHHVPDPQAGLTDCVRKLKPGAPLLIYLYYAFENRPAWFRSVWRLSNLLRLGICRLPFPLRYAASQTIAATVYWPLARLSLVLEKLGWQVEHVPLSFYRNRDFYSMRTDALDRFGTRIEKRFTALQIRQMMEGAGLGSIEFSDSAPFWCAVGYKLPPVGR
jgi:ubiquinone/menaquinone biosynthesis C-methylase UbiE